MAKIVGGGGVSQVAGGDNDTAGLQKMYLSSVLRGKGLAKQIVLMSLEFAKAQGLHSLLFRNDQRTQAAIKLYEKLGFEFIDEPLGNTGHSDCEIRMLKAL